MGGDLWDYVSGGHGKSKPVTKALPIVAIPSTAGTGTEIDPWGVITDEELCEKIGFGFEQTYPTLSVVDPEIMVSVPAKLTAYQGFDAFFHAAEGYINTESNGMVEIAEIGFPQVLSHLIQSKGDDISPLDGRELMAEKVHCVWMMAGKWECGLENNFCRNPRSRIGGAYFFLFVNKTV